MLLFYTNLITHLLTFIHQKQNYTEDYGTLVRNFAHECKTLRIKGKLFEIAHVLDMQKESSFRALAEQALNDLKDVEENSL